MPTNDKTIVELLKNESSKVPKWKQSKLNLKYKIYTPQNLNRKTDNESRILQNQLSSTTFKNSKVISKSEVPNDRVYARSCSYRYTSGDIKYIGD